MNETLDVNQLRRHLFDAIEGIKSKSISIEQAKAVADLSQVIINSAKVEVEYAKASGGKIASGFLPDKPAVPGLTVHRMRD